ncbi:YSC84-related protein [Terrimonas ferruginea]|uniref:lipid-binding SYLF domain-containing protein n=1 Tax=Terrimonas ferruginea TaxID=249 RepID=UPI000684BA33|nr:YSC84-related protein [Terrimonas ferruginea]
MKRSIIALLGAILFSPFVLSAQSSRIVQDSKTAKAEFIKADANMAKLFTSSYGYAIFPNVGKGGVVVGGAAGAGAVYEQGKLVGGAELKQVSVGAQIGGQAYREVVFFENKAALDRFKANKVEFSAQLGAIAATEGASANAQYTDGLMVFTQTKGGLMAEATVAGQKFSYKAR